MSSALRRNDSMTRFIRLVALLACALPLAAAGQQGSQITPNYKDADLGQVIEAVSQVTGKPWVGKGGETGLERIVTLKAEAAGLAAEDLVGPVIAEMQVRLRELRDAEAGQGSLADRMGDNVTPVKPEEGSE